MANLDDELLDEQMMLRALLAESDTVEDSSEEQVPFNESFDAPLERVEADKVAAQATKPTVLPTPVKPEPIKTEAKAPKAEVKPTNRSSAALNSIPTLANPVSAPADSLNLGKITCTLSFELGSCQLSHDQISRLKPGHIFNLSKNFSAPVTVWCQGQTLGNAEIVDIEGSVGIRMVSPQ